MRHWTLHALILRRTKYSSRLAGVHFETSALRPEGVPGYAHADTHAGKPATVLAEPGMAKGTCHYLIRWRTPSMHVCGVAGRDQLTETHTCPDLSGPAKAEVVLLLLTSVMPRPFRSGPRAHTGVTGHEPSQDCTIRGGGRMIGHGPALPLSFRPSSVHTGPQMAQNTNDGGVPTARLARPAEPEPACSACPTASSAHSTGNRMMAHGPPPYHTIAALGTGAGHNRTNVDAKMIRHGIA